MELTLPLTKEIAKTLKLVILSISLALFIPVEMRPIKKLKSL